MTFTTEKLNTDQKAKAKTHLAKNQNLFVDI